MVSLPLATASEKGTLIRVWCTSTSTLLNEFRRGADRAWIHCITFDHLDKFIASSSDKGTIHIFSLEDGKPDGSTSTKSEVITEGEGKEGDSTGAPIVKPVPNETSVGAFGFSLKSFLPTYFSSVWSYAQFRVPETRSICAFTSTPFTLMILTAEGTAYKVDFSKGGEAVKTEYSKFVKAEEDATT